MQLNEAQTKSILALNVLQIKQDLQTIEKERLSDIISKCYDNLEFNATNSCIKKLALDI